MFVGVTKQLKDAISVLKTENVKKITTLAKLHLRGLEDLRIKNESIRHELKSKKKFTCNHCGFKTQLFPSLRCHTNRNQEGQQFLKEEYVSGQQPSNESNYKDNSIVSESGLENHKYAIIVNFKTTV